MTTTAKITKLAEELEKCNKNIQTWTERRAQVAAKIGAIIQTPLDTEFTNAKTSPAKKGGTPLSDRVRAAIAKSPGVTIVQLRSMVKEKPNKIGLALYHLEKKGLIFSKEGSFFAGGGNILTAAAKTAKTMPGDE